MPKAVKVAQSGLQGWRSTLADNVAAPVSSRTPLSPDQVQAAIGALFFALSVSYVIKTVRSAAREMRG